MDRVEVYAVDRGDEAALDALLVCGLGPVQLARLNGSAQRFPHPPYNRHNALAAKLLASTGWTRRVIMSGWPSNQGPPDRDPDAHAQREMQTAEGDLLVEIYRRMRGPWFRPADEAALNRLVLVDRLARTTVGNLMAGLNILDALAGGAWRGRLGVLSTDAQLPRTAEIARAFGLHAVTVLSARQVLIHYGYRADRLFPVEGSTDEAAALLRNNLTGWLNLRHNPAYVTYDLPKIDSDRRLQTVAAHLQRYYQDRGIAVPAVYERLPVRYDPVFDYKELRWEFGQVPLSKHAYPEAADPEGYERLITGLATRTAALLTTGERTELSRPGWTEGSARDAGAV